MADLNKPAPEPKRSWADEAEDDQQTSSEKTETVATPPITEAVDRLSIGGEGKTEENRGLDSSDKTDETRGLDLSDGSEIKAVNSPLLVLVHFLEILQILRSEMRVFPFREF